MATAQQFYSIKVDYSVKYKGANGEQMLQIGTVSYDMNRKSIIIRNSFPDKEVLVQEGNKIKKIINGTCVQTFDAPVPVDLSVFHLALSSRLENFGLDQLSYSMEDIKKEKDLVMTSWKPHEKLQNKLGRILISTKNKQLFAIIFTDINDNVISKHFYRKYVNINGFMFPSETVRISYFGKKQSYEVTSYKNIRLNEFDDFSF